MQEVFQRQSQSNDPYCGMEMGDKVEDTFTGFTGIIIARSEHLTGCNQIYVLPASVDPSKINDGDWFDVERLKLVQKGVVKQSFRETGCDIPPPSRATSGAR